MAKVPFSKLGLKINNDIKVIKYNDLEIEIKQYLSTNDKLQLISNVLNLAADENNFSNPIKLEVYTALEIISAYTNISFTEKQKEDPAKLYDLFFSNELYKMIVEAIPEKEISYINKGVVECSNAIYTYRNSILGILDIIGTDYSLLEYDIDSLQQKIKDGEGIALLKDIITKLD